MKTYSGIVVFQVIYTCFRVISTTHPRIPCTSHFLNGKFINDLVPHKSFLLPYHQQINMNIEDENTWDETISSERTGEQYQRAPDFGRGRRSFDDEEPSLHSDSSSLLKGKQRSKFVIARKSTMAFLTFFLLASLAAFGYFFSEYMIQRQARKR